ncbi:MAG TPA: TonB-dependent receptor [Thermoanaerobaculia bacterium]
MATRTLIRSLLLVVCLLAPVAAFAQLTTGSINGTVTDDSGAALPGVTLTARNVATGASRTTITESDGSFNIPLLQPGTYEVTAELEGFRPAVARNVAVNLGVSVDVRLKLQVGASETMTVTAEAPVVETTKSEVSSVVNETYIENLPVNGRNFIDFVLTTPGVVRDVRAGDISFAGQRGTLNSLVIDGANNDNTFFGQTLGRTGSGRAPYQFSQDAVKEFHVQSNAYSAEFGRAGGAVINVITKSGTNDFDGTAFYFVRDKKYNANDFINVFNNRAKSPYHFDQYGASFGGPIVPDRHFFFVNYDAQRNSLPNLIVLGLPSNYTPPDAASASGLAKLQALAGDYSRNQDQDVYLIKTDHELGAANHLSFRYNRQDFVGKNFENGGPTNAAEHTGNSNVLTDTFSLVLTSTLSNTLFNEARFQYAKDQEPGLANSAMPEALVRHNGATVLTIGRNNFSPRETTIKRWQLADTGTWALADHTFKAGFDYSKDDILNFFPGNFSGSYTFDSLADFDAGRASRYIQAFAGPGTSGPITNPDIAETGVFVQDEWRVRPSLVLNAGLRYDFQRIAQPEVRNPDAQLLAAGLDTSVIPEDSNNFAPRVGFAWTPGNDNRTVVRGGYGIFYGRTPAIMIGTAHSNNGINVQTITFTGAQVPVYPTILTTLPTGATVGRPTIFAFSPEFENPEVHQASFGVERAVRNDLSVGFSYQHVQGNDLQRSRDINVGSSEIVTAPIQGGGSLSYRRYTGARPFANFARIIVFESTADSLYNGYTVDVNKHFSHNWQARLSYTWSRVEDNKPDATAVVPGGGDDAKFIQDPLNIDGDWAPGDNDVRHRIVFSGVWNLDGYASRTSGWQRALLGGWSVSGIASYQTGQPYSRLVSSDLNNDGNNRNDRVPGTERNSERLPSIFTVDPRITKEIAMFGGARLQLIAEAFNVFNESNVSLERNTFYGFGTIPGSTPAVTGFLPQTNPLTGYGTPSASVGPRIVQLAAKIIF